MTTIFTGGLIRIAIQAAGFCVNIAYGTEGVQRYSPHYPYLWVNPHKDAESCKVIRNYFGIVTFSSIFCGLLLTSPGSSGLHLRWLLGTAKLVNKEILECYRCINYQTSTIKHQPSIQPEYQTSTYPYINHLLSNINQMPLKTPGVFLPPLRHALRRC